MMKECFSSNFSSGHVESSFDNAAESFPSTVRKDLARTPKVMKKCFSSNFSSGHVKSSFDNAAESFPSTVRKDLARTPNVIKNVFLQFFLLDTAKTSFTRLPKIFSKKSEKFRPNSDSGEKKQKFFKTKNFSLKCFNG